MPTTFSSFNDGDLINDEDVEMYAVPVNALEMGTTYWGGTSTGTSTAYVVDMNPNFSAYNAGMLIHFKAHTDCGAGPVSLAVDSLAAKTIKKNATADLAAADIKSGQVVAVVYDGTNFQLLGSATVLDNLSDVAITSPASAQMLRYNGTLWVNTALVAADIASGQVGLARGGTGADLSATGGAGQVLKQSTVGSAVTVGVLAAADLPSGIDAAKIGGGGVTSTEFGYLSSVTSDIQTQLNSKSSSIVVGTAWSTTMPSATFNSTTYSTSVSGTANRTRNNSNLLVSVSFGIQAATSYPANRGNFRLQLVNGATTVNTTAFPMRSPYNLLETSHYTHQFLISSATLGSNTGSWTIRLQLASNTVSDNFATTTDTSTSCMVFEI